MSATTSIEWTDKTWNPIRGCSKVSDGCRNCYAEWQARRFAGSGQPYEGVLSNGLWNGKVHFAKDHLEDPLRWRKPCRVFVNSMSDLFHENVPDEVIDQVFAVMALARQHTFQVLTKRPKRMLAYLRNFSVSSAFERIVTENEAGRIGTPDDSLAIRISREFSPLGVDPGDGVPDPSWPLPNVWLGVSIEDQATAIERIPPLLHAATTVRFVSAEPLLGAVDLRRVRWESDEKWPPAKALDWVIAGGETGPWARPMHPDWPATLRDQCQAAGVPFFFKQWGEWADRTHGRPPSKCRVILRDGWFYPEAKVAPGRIRPEHLSSTGGWAPGLHPMSIAKVGRKRAGRELDGRTWDEMPGGTES